MSSEVHVHIIEGLTLRTGDLICTVDGGGETLPGQFWRLIGKLIPGEVDHVVVYVGPGGRCIEAGAAGTVADFEVPEGRWDAQAMSGARACLMDKFYGAAYPFGGRGLSPQGEEAVRLGVARYCQAQLGKPYNLNFIMSHIDSAFYCSQLAYKAYLEHGIDFNTGEGVPRIPFTESIIFPQEVWESNQHKKPE